MLVAALVAPSSQAAAPLASNTPAVLHREGRWLVDAQGRVVLLHGVNAVWKRAPYVPPATAAGFTAKDADWIAAQGFNTVRLGVIFAGVMPSRGRVDQQYLAAVARVVDLLAARKVWVLLDFHQDLYSEKFSGEGFPAWAVHDDGIPQPVDAGFPGNYFLPATSRAFDNFYANVDGLADLYAQAWRAVAARFAATPHVLGYDVMNEPWPGTSFATCANPVGCPVFDTQSLQPLYEKVVAAIRTVDRARIVWLEPQVLFNDGAQTALGARKPFTDPQLGLSFHQYCTTAGVTHSSGGKAGPECGPQGELVFGNADKVATSKGWTSLLTEYGASDDLPDVARVTAAADEHLTGWQYWHYKEWSDPTTESQGSGGQGLFTNDKDLSTLKQAKADVLVRPFARAVAGIPSAMTFDPATKAFTLTYTAKPKTGLTEVFLPARQYPKGYAVAVTGASVVSAPGATLLLLQASRAGTVTVTVTRR
ncbi:MAG: endoglycoceramidase [Frankiales bacterium]|nr:endoglycoceramidase [Frankiales bacterium]